MHPLRHAVFCAGLAIVFAAMTTGTLLSQSDEPIQFRSQVSRVIVDVLVLDEDREPVKGLVQKDFELFEDGVEQQIESFDVTDWSSYVSSASSLAEDTLESEAGEDSSAANNGSFPITTNRFPRRFVLIVNRRSSKFTELVQARRALNEFVVESMADGDQAMILDIGPSVEVVQEFVANKEQTLQGLKRLSRMPTTNLYRGDMLTYRALRDLARELEQVPGRKVVVFMSKDLQLYGPPGSSSTNETPYMMEAAESLNQANATLYGINLELASSFAPNVFDGGLASITLETGGRYFENLTTFAPALNRIGKENAQYYLLSYAPPRSDPDGEFHRVEVRLRDPSFRDYEIVARKGYRAVEASPPVTDTTDATDAEESSASRSTAVDMDLEAKHLPLPNAVEVSTYLLPNGEQVLVPFSVALPRELIGESARSLQVAIRQPGQGEEPIASYEQLVDRERFFLRDRLHLEPGSYELSLHLSENSGEAVYETTVGFDVIDLDSKRLGLTNLVPLLSPAPESLAMDAAALSPALAVREGEDALLFFRILAPHPANGDSVRLSYAVRHERAVVTQKSLPNPIALKGVQEGTAVVLKIPFRELNPGTYRVEIIAEQDSSGLKTSGEIELRIP